jgi:hypothetical protein
MCCINRKNGVKITPLSRRRSSVSQGVLRMNTWNELDARLNKRYLQIVLDAEEWAPGYLSH